MGEQAIRFRVSGRVQGVFFRKYTKRAADDCRLAGYVLNERDGSVSGIAQGAGEALDRFIQFLHRGSPNARVDQVTTEVIPAATLSGFDIRR